MAESKEYKKQSRELLYAFRFLAEAIDARDPYTLGHMNRVARYCMKIFDQLPKKNEEETREILLVAAFLHDVGYLKIPEYILKKPASLTVLERMEVELHPIYSLTILGEGILSERVGPIIRAHHELCDGSGYPDGLSADDIPYCSKIIHVADVFDACTSPRGYRSGNKLYTDREAIKLLVDSANNNKADKDIVHSFIKAYNNCDIIMAKAASFSDIKNPLLSRPSGVSINGQLDRDSPPVIAAQRNLLKALELIEKMEGNHELRDPDFWIQRKYKILIRLATMYNLAGMPSKALSYCEAAEIYTPEQEQRDHISLQRALAYHMSGQRTKAVEIGNLLKKSKNKDWFQALLFHMLAECSLVTGHFADADTYEMKALKCVARMKDKVNKDSLSSPLGVFLRWWNPDRINWLAGLLKLTCTKRHCYMGYEFTIELAEKTASQFELTGNIEQRSKARLELARFYSNSGNFDRAVAIFNREYHFAELIRDKKLAVKRAVWFAETYMRKAVCLADKMEKQQELANAHSLIDKYLMLFGKQKIKKELKPYIDIGMLLLLWYENKRDMLLARLPGILKSIKQSNTIFFLEASIICHFLNLANNKESAFCDFLELIEMAQGYNIAIRELEIYAEVIKRFPEQSAELENRTQVLLKRMDGQCWLLHHPDYREIMIHIMEL